MQSLSNVLVRGRRAGWVLASAALVSVGLAGCGGKEEAPMPRATIKISSITQNGNCEDVNVKVMPVSILPGAPQLANKSEFLTPVKLAKSADNVSCVGESVTRPMAPGKWKFLVGLPSDTASCERDIAAGGTLEVNMKDGEKDCK